ncbi:MAG TPA: flagellin [Phenylobacterium sp.]|jgi:flagellar hook-associated protein 3 FlgL|uniref:flagellin n=1 Tax=Phenylobacterium sp. TaxID=1871053 RepID=UPI002D45B632|nr:flagellin [Phenylobacterium sp.]HZZ67074.1 flagellin [Phenylobacterium sp.]
MVDRVSTAGQYSAILANLMTSESQQTDAANRVSSQVNGTDLKSYALQAETLTAMKSVDARITGYQAQNTLIAAKLSTQDQALTGIASSATAVRQALSDALASNDATSFMQEVQGQFQTAVSGLNTQYDGKYLFAGGQIDTQPVTASAMTDLTAGSPPLPAISSFFQNDSQLTQAKLDDTTTVTTGQVASTLGSPMLTAFQAIQDYNDGPNGPLTGTLNATQQAFLTTQLQNWTTIGTNLTQAAAQNGLVQQQVSAVASSLTTQQNTLTGMIGDITDADMAKAATDLSDAQLSVQASAKVLQALQSDSLLTLLPVA